MKHPGPAALIGALLLCLAVLFGRLAPASTPGTAELAAVTVDYPLEGSIFPPDFTAPTFLWRDASPAKAWLIEIAFADGSAPLRVKAPGERLRVGEIDTRCISSTNELPKLTPQQAASLSWVPDAATWATIQKHSVGHLARITITGFRDKAFRKAVSRGGVAIQTSKDPVGAPIFYRDVPLMPSEGEKGVIRPLADNGIPLIAWRLRDLSEPRSRVVLEGIHTCANCHSFSADGKTLGMDLDGPQNDKGLYAIVPVGPRTTIRNEDVITWNTFQDPNAGRMRVGFMSQISPDGQYVVTTVAAERDLLRNYYVANFKDYRFLQVFYATRGVLVWYSRATGKRQFLPGADDPRYVQASAVWSPDGKYLVFVRAEAKDAYPEHSKPAEYANDPNEAQIQYDLYRIPFNGGQGGRAEPILGASQNGMSNSFPKVSPDGRWIVFVKSRNGQLMRPDSQLYIVPSGGGEARRMRSNTSLMNSWHSFSPNGRWLVFSSKSRSPYTQMYLTHIDEEGNDSPAILVENSTAANRAVNIPEFVNIRPEGLSRIDVPAVEFYTLFNRALELQQNHKYAAAIAEWRKALEMSPADARALNNLAFNLAQEGKLDEAIADWQKALNDDDDYAEVHTNLARALYQVGRPDEAIVHWRKAVEIRPGDSQAHDNLGVALMKQGNLAEAIPHLQKAVEINPGDAGAHYDLGLALLRAGRGSQAIAQYRAALVSDPGNAQAHNELAVALSQEKRFDEAVAEFEKAIEADGKFAQAYSNLGNTLYLQGKTRDALAQWRRALGVNGKELAALTGTAWVLATSSDASLRDGVEAVKLAAQAVELSGGGDCAILDAQAAGYAESGRFAEALETARRALALAAEQKKQLLQEGLKARIALYERHQPFRETPLGR
jgi:tetratricopeptide (TPR) repeat protein